MHSEYSGKLWSMESWCYELYATLKRMGHFDKLVFRSRGKTYQQIRWYYSQRFCAIEKTWQQIETFLEKEDAVFCTLLSQKATIAFFILPSLRIQRHGKLFKKKKSSEGIWQPLKYFARALNWLFIITFYILASSSKLLFSFSFHLYIFFCIYSI